jgi:predicted DNA binding CopG/RHH family protein
MEEIEDLFSRTPLGTCTRRKWQLMKKRVPRLKTDQQAEAFLAQDLSNLDYSRFKPIQFEFEKKEDQINMRMPRRLLTAVKARAKARGIPYTRFIRETLEQAIIASK